MDTQRPTDEPPKLDTSTGGQLSEGDALYHDADDGDTERVTSALLHWDSQDPASEGWAYRVTFASGHTESGSITGPGRDADLSEVLDAIDGTELPIALLGEDAWERFDHDGGGWKLRQE